MTYTKKEYTMATAIVYASSTGNTELVSRIISKELGDIGTFDIAQSGIEEIVKNDKIILGISTWGDGELQDDWEELWEDFKSIDFTNKTIALFGLGDQEGYPDTFLDAMGLVYEHLIQTDAKVIGHWAITEEYFYEESLAIENGAFVGLALDEDTQDDLSEERIVKWCDEIRNEIL